MDKILLIFVLCSLSQAAYISRMAPLRFRGPSPFRPGVILQRPVFPPRLMTAASHRTPFIVYRNVPQRFAVKPMMVPTVTRNVFGIPWKTTAHIPVPVTPEYDYARAASAQPVIRTDGAIHTIPAPNLSLSEKPIVVADVATESRESETPLATELNSQEKPAYEVTERNSESQTYNVQAKIEAPIGFYKQNSGINYEYKNIQNEGSQQINPEYGLIQVQQQMPSIVPQEFSVQKYNLPSHQDLIHAGAEGIIIPPNALLQSDPTFLQKLQTQLLQRYPAVEFIPYNPDNIQSQIQPQTLETQQTSYYFNNDQFIKQEPMAFVPSENTRNIVQRKTQEGTVQSLTTQAVPENNNVTLSQTDSSTPYTTENAVSSVAADMQSSTKVTDKIEENKTVDNKTNPVYYAQIGDSISNVVTNSIYTATNDINAAFSEQPIVQDFNNRTKLEITTTAATTTQEATTKHYLDHKVKPESNEILKEFSNFVASPFEKPAESVNIAYSIFKVTESTPTIVQNVTQIADKIVKTSQVNTSQTKEINRERSFFSRAPVRFTITEKRSIDDQPHAVKAQLPPKSKLIFDHETGEPILRVYASYVDNPARKEVITNKLLNMRPSREALMKKQENFERFDAATVNALALDVNQYGLKLKSRNDETRQIILEEYN